MGSEKGIFCFLTWDTGAILRLHRDSTTLYQKDTISDTNDSWRVY